MGRQQDPCNVSLAINAFITLVILVFCAISGGGNDVGVLGAALQVRTEWLVIGMSQNFIDFIIMNSQLPQITHTAFRRGMDEG